MGAPTITDAARAVAGERARCLDAVDAAWRDMVERARARRLPASRPVVHPTGSLVVVLLPSGATVAPVLAQTGRKVTVSVAGGMRSVVDECQVLPHTRETGRVAEGR